MSNDFNYTKVIRLAHHESFKPGHQDTVYPVKGPATAGRGLRGIIQQRKYHDKGEYVTMFEDIRSQDARDGIHFIIHDPFEAPSESSLHAYTLVNQEMEFRIIPKITKYDESLEAFDPEE